MKSQRAVAAALDIQGAVNSMSQRTSLLRLMLLVFLGALCLRVTLSSLGPVMEQIATDLKLSSAKASIILTIPILCMGICALFAKPLADRVGIERGIALCLLLVAFSTFLRTLYINYSLILVSSFIMGTGIAIAGPLLSGFVKKHFVKQTAKGMVLYSLGISFSGILGTMGFFVLNKFTKADWAFSLELWSLPILMVGLLWSFFFLFKKNHDAVNDVPVKLPWNNWRVWTLSICFGLQSGIFYSILAWLVPYLKSHGFSEHSAQLMLNTYMWNGPMGSLVFPLLLLRFPKQVAIYSCTIAISLMLFSLAIAPTFLTPIVMLILGMTANAGIFAIIISLPFYEVNNGNAVASWSAMIFSIGYCISAIMPTFFGRLYDITGSYGGVMWGLLICSLILLAALAVFVNKRAPAQ